MEKEPYPKQLLLFLILILVLQIVALVFYWYWRIPWFDILMHFLGGMWVGMSVLWIYFNSKRFVHTAKRSTWHVFTVAIFSVFIVALLWELFEYIVFITIPHEALYNIPDTLGDILSGIIGSVIAALIFVQKQFIFKNS